VGDAPAECAVWPKSAVQVGPRAGGRFDLPRNRPLFLGHYSELHQAHVLFLINKIANPHFGLLQRSDGAEHIRISGRELYEQASFSPKLQSGLFNVSWCNTLR